MRINDVRASPQTAQAKASRSIGRKRLAVFVGSAEDVGRHAEAIAEVEIAQRLDSRSPIINTVYGDVLRLAGHSDAARLQLEHTLAMDPDFAYAHAILGNVYLQENLIARAAEEYRRATIVSPHSPWYMSMLAFCDGRVGKRAEAQKLLEALAQSQNSYVPLVDIAATYEAVGQEREALAYLEKAFDERDVKLRWVETKPNFEGLHSNQKFQDLLRRIRAAQGKAPLLPGVSQSAALCATVASASIPMPAPAVS